jgi:hypothetical protein
MSWASRLYGREPVRGIGSGSVAAVAGDMAPQSARRPRRDGSLVTPSISSKKWSGVMSIASIYKIPLVLTAQPEGGSTVTSPLLAELITEGDTIGSLLVRMRLMIDAHLIGFTWRQGRVQDRLALSMNPHKWQDTTRRCRRGALLRAYARTPALGKSPPISMPRPAATPIPSWISARQKWHSWR